MTRVRFSSHPNSNSPVNLLNFDSNTMASLGFLRGISVISTRSSPHLLRTIRNYVAAPAKTAWTPRTYTKTTPVAAASASTSAATSTENPSTIESLPNTSSDFKVSSESPSTPQLQDGISEEGHTDWSKSYFGLSSQAFSKDIADILLAPIDPMDIEMKPGTSFLSDWHHSCAKVV